MEKIKFSDFPAHRDLSAKEAEKVKDITTWLIFRSQRRLTARRLMKLYYMAEIRSIEIRGKRLSSVDFVNWKYGPWSQAVAMISDASHPDIEMKTSTSLRGRKYKIYGPKIPETKVALDKAEMAVLSEVLDEWKGKETEPLVQASKETEPFQQSNYREKINFDAYVKCLAELGSQQAQGEMKKNLADALAGKGSIIKNKSELAKFRPTP